MGAWPEFFPMVISQSFFVSLFPLPPFAKEVLISRLAREPGPFFLSFTYFDGDLRLAARLSFFPLVLVSLFLSSQCGLLLLARVSIVDLRLLGSDVPV